MHRNAVIAAALAAFMAGPAAAKEFKSADIHPPGYPTVAAVEYFGELLKQRSNGKYTLKIYNSGTLGEEKDTIGQTKLGALDFNRINMAPFNNIVPETAVPTLPFLFRSVDHMHKVMDGPIGEQILKSLESQGFVGLAFYDSGARSFYTVKKPVKALEDLKGMKIRVQQSDLFVGMIKALGANPTPMPYGEVYTALKTGVVDAAENNWPSFESSRHFEVAKFFTLSEHSMSPELFVMSKKVWDGLPADDQKIIKQAAKDSVPKMRELWQAREKESEATVRKAGVEIITLADKKPFIDAMKPVYGSFANKPELKKMIEDIQATQ